MTEIFALGIPNTCDRSLPVIAFSVLIFLPVISVNCAVHQSALCLLRCLKRSVNYCIFLLRLTSSFSLRVLHYFPSVPSF